MQTEADGNGVLHVDNLAILTAWRPVGHAVDDAKCLSIEGRIHRLYHAGITDRAVLVDNERGNYTALFLSLCRFLRILDALRQM